MARKVKNSSLSLTEMGDLLSLQQSAAITEKINKQLLVVLSQLLIACQILKAGYRLLDDDLNRQVREAIPYLTQDIKAYLHCIEEKGEKLSQNKLREVISASCDRTGRLTAL